MRYTYPELEIENYYRDISSIPEIRLAAMVLERALTDAVIGIQVLDKLDTQDPPTTGYKRRIVENLKEHASRDISWVIHSSSNTNSALWWLSAINENAEGLHESYIDLFLSRVGGGATLDTIIDKLVRAERGFTYNRYRTAPTERTYIDSILTD